MTRARIDFASPINDEFAEATAPIPTIGFAGRAYAARNLAVGGEMTFFKIPGGEDRDYDGSYFDYDFYATLNFNNNAGVTGGWRKLDLDYTVKEDFGSLDLRGPLRPGRRAVLGAAASRTSTARSASTLSQIPTPPPSVRRSVRFVSPWSWHSVPSARRSASLLTSVNRDPHAEQAEVAVAAIAVERAARRARPG